jgi:hypothetical protein
MYNQLHDIKSKISGFCEICQKQTSNISQHRKTKRHLSKIK